MNTVKGSCSSVQSNAKKMEWKRLCFAIPSVDTEEFKDVWDIPRAWKIRGR